VIDITADGTNDMADAMSEGEGIGCVAGAQDEGVEDAGSQDSVVEAVPQSPTPSTPFSDVIQPPLYDTGIQTMGTDNSATSGDEEGCLPTSGVAAGDQSCRFVARKGKRVRGLDDKGNGGHSGRKRPKRRPKESDDETDESGEDHLSRSAEASRKLNESLRSGTFVVDEGKRGRFEEKCRQLDGHAKFCYKKSWRVRHSKCSTWVKMREPYDVVRFSKHIAENCKRMGEKGRNGTIDSFFKRQGAGEMGTTRMAKPSARKEIITGIRAKPRETLIPSIPFTSNERPCLGLGKDEDERIGTYISRVITEGAGSCSDTKITQTLFGHEVKYSQLNDDDKRYVAATQVHMQKWRISHTLGAVFSANCRGNVIVTDKTQNSTCDQCLGLLKLDVFKKALGVQPPPLENLKFTPHRYRNAATNLGMNLAKIEGFSSLLETVSYSHRL